MLIGGSDGLMLIITFVSLTLVNCLIADSVLIIYSLIFSLVAAPALLEDILETNSTYLSFFFRT